MKQQDAAYFVDSSGVALGGVPRFDDQLREGMFE
jgi:hypothetical protein